MADLDEVAELVECLLEEHDSLRGWTFKYDDAKRRFGQCNYRDQQITLSRSLVELNGMDQVTDTILHEIAHALAGGAAGHGPRWRLQARELGCTATRCYDGETVAQEEGPWVGTCPLCGGQMHKWRQPTRAVACTHCCKMVNNGKFMREARYTWEYRP